MPDVAPVRTIRPPILLGSKELTNHRYEYYRWMLENAPVCKARLGPLRGVAAARFEDCEMLLRDKRFVRRRSTYSGESRWNALMPRSLRISLDTMISQDNPNHRRLRGFVNKAFTPKAIRSLAPRIESVTQELLDAMEAKVRDGAPVDLVADYALPLPVQVISEMLGIDDADMPGFVDLANTITDGLTGLRLIRTILWDLPRSIPFMEGVIARKRAAPGEDILSALIQLEEDGDRLSVDELIGMVFLLVTAGHETTVHLIAGTMVTLLQHPEVLQTLRDDPERIAPAIEEVLRYASPVQSTERLYPREDVELQGVHIPKGTMIVALIGAANRDPRAFEDPDVFNIDRSPNRHLGFGKGAHFCLGAHLARMETRIAIGRLLERFGRIELAVPASELNIRPVPLMQMYRDVPLLLA